MTSFRKRWVSEAGGALVELAVALPVVVVIFAGTIDFARVFYTSMALTDAARAGAQYGSINTANSVDIPGMQSAATGATNTSGISAAASNTCKCATDAGVFDATAVSCTSTCTSPKHMVITVTVTTTKTFTTIITGFPAIPSSVSLSRTATLRVHQ
jgi:Flp pilus assembly protein TadG